MISYPRYDCVKKISLSSPLKVWPKYGRLLAKAVVLILLLAVAGLTTGAKNSLYYPRPDSVHYLSIASKVKVPASPAQINQSPLHPVAKLEPPRPAIRTAPENEAEAPPVRLLCVTIALQHRSPPPVIS
jgi:hypothetical protein